MRTFFVFDVESIGLHGEGYAAAYVVISEEGVLEEGCFSCPTVAASGGDSNRKWISENIPELEVTHDFPEGVRCALWDAWMKWKEKGAWMAADCLWPVEARFLIDHVEKHPDMEWEGPYPFVDIGSVLLGVGMDPLSNYDRIHGEENKHHPLHDARQSARLLREALKS